VIVADAYGPFTRIFCDFGPHFEVLDKNGEELQQVMVKNISKEGPEALVELLPNIKHSLEDGDQVQITGVEGLTGINETVHKVKVISPYSFRIGDTSGFEGEYQRNGIVKQLKTKAVLTFKEFKEAALGEEIPLDGNMAVADFEKMANTQLAHIAFEALDKYKDDNDGNMPGKSKRNEGEELGEKE